MDHGKRSILLPPPPKLKKEEKTYCFELTLGQSTDESYPEFSWKDLIQDAKRKELETKSEKGRTLLNPYASDDDDELKAMAERLEQKYNKPTSGKRKRKAEDYIDRGAGYDESDSFIDNSDIYDEIVPEDMQPVLGGFYINSGPLDFKEVEVSDCDVDEEIEELHNARKIKKIPKQTPKEKEPNSIKRRRISNTSGSSGSKKVNKTKIGTETPKGRPVEETCLSGKLKVEDSDKTNPKKKTSMIISSSSESSSSSEDSSSSSSSSTSSEDKTAPQKERPAVSVSPISPHPSPPKLKKMTPPKHNNSQVEASNPPRRLKLKNVPLNPKLHGGKTTAPTESNSKPPTLELEPIIQNSSNKTINVPAELASAYASSNLANSQLYKSMPDLQISSIKPKGVTKPSKTNEMKQFKARKSEGNANAAAPVFSNKMNVSLNIPPLKSPQASKPRKPRVSSSASGASNSNRQNPSKPNNNLQMHIPVSTAATIQYQLMLQQQAQAVAIALQGRGLQSSQSKTDLLRTTQLLNSVTKGSSSSSAISINPVDAALKSFSSYPNHLSMNAFTAAGLSSLANIGVGELSKKTKQANNNKVQPPLSISPLSATITSRSNTPPVSRPNSASPVNQIQNRISPSITITPHQGTGTGSSSNGISNNKLSSTSTSTSKITWATSSAPSSTPSPHNYPKMNKPHITGFDMNSLLSTNPSSSSSGNKNNLQLPKQPSQPQQNNYNPRHPMTK